MRAEPTEPNNNKKMEQQTQTDIKAKIAELREKYTRLSKTCSSWARISPDTINFYIKQIQTLEAQLNNQQMKGGDEKWIKDY